MREIVSKKPALEVGRSIGTGDDHLSLTLGTETPDQVQTDLRASLFDCSQTSQGGSNLIDKNGASGPV